MNNPAIDTKTTTTNTAVTIAHNATFNFRNWKQGQAGYDKLTLAINEERLTTEDIKVSRVDVEGKPDDRSQDLYQRKPLNLALPVLLISSVIKDDAELSTAQLDHLQCLVNQACEKAHSNLVEAGNVKEADIISWEQVLSQPFKQRTAAVKITEAMLKAATELFIAYLQDVGSNPKGIELITKLGLKKFGIAACATTKKNILEAIQERVAGFIESLEASVAHEHVAVLELWSGNLEKVLNPELEEDIDESMI